MFSNSQEVPPNAIERELVRIWREAASTDTAEGSSTSRIRAILANCVIIVRSYQEQKAVLEELITELSISHPSRFFIISLNTDGDANVRTGVSSRCVLTRAGKHICTEEIYIESKCSELSVTPNLVRSLLVADLPVVGIVLDDLKEVQASEVESCRHDYSELVSRLAPLFDRLIYDSSTFHGYAQNVAAVLALYQTNMDRLSSCTGVEHPLSYVRDLNWTRLARWRALVAEQFDSPLFANATEFISSIRVYTNESPDSIIAGKISSDALLFAGWFMHSLGLEPGKMFPPGKNSGLVVNTLKDGESGPALEFMSREHNSASVNPNFRRMITCIRLTLLVGGMPAHVTLRRILEKSVTQISTEVRAGSLGDSSVCDFAIRSKQHPVKPLHEYVLQNIVDTNEESQFINALRASERLAIAITV